MERRRMRRVMLACAIAGALAVAFALGSVFGRSSESPSAAESHELEAFQFVSSWETESCALEGPNVGLRMNVSCPKMTGFTVSLYRGHAFVGSVTRGHAGSLEATWTNVGPGTYHFEIEKEGAAIAQCSDVTAFGW